jgi:hypothetical protein
MEIGHAKGGTFTGSTVNVNASNISQSQSGALNSQSTRIGVDG